MHRSLLIFAVAFMALMAGALFYAARIPVEQAERSGAPAPAAKLEIVEYPDFTLIDLDREPRAFSEWQGRHRLLNFWATWCAPCRREIPVLKAFQEEQGDDGILVMGIAVDVFEEVVEYAKATQFNYPILVGERDAMAVAESTGVEFVAMPFTMIVTREGQYLNSHLGELHADQLEQIDAILARLDAGELTTDDAKAALGRL